MEKLGLLESFKQSATTDSDIAGSSGEAGLSWPRGNDVDSAAATAAALLAGEARPSRIVKYSVTSESEPELAESSDEEPSPRQRRQQWTAQQWAEWRRRSKACHRWKKERGPVGG